MASLVTVKGGALSESSSKVRFQPLKHITQILRRGWKILKRLFWIFCSIVFSLVVLESAVVNTYVFYFQPIYTEWQEAENCMAVVSNYEGNVLDRPGEQLIAWVIANNAAQMKGDKPLYHKMCDAAGRNHFNRTIRGQFPDYSAVQKIKPEIRSTWDRSLSIARLTILIAQMEDWTGFKWAGRPLGKEYTFYHNAPAPTTFTSKNKVACDKRYPYKDSRDKNHSIDFCRKA